MENVTRSRICLALQAGLNSDPEIRRLAPVTQIPSGIREYAQTRITGQTILKNGRLTTLRVLSGMMNVEPAAAVFTFHIAMGGDIQIVRKWCITCRTGIRALTGTPFCRAGSF